MQEHLLDMQKIDYHSLGVPGTENEDLIITISPLAPEIIKMKVNTQTQWYFPKIFTLLIYFLYFVFMTFICILQTFIEKISIK